MNKRRILVIDDEVGFTTLVKLNLERTGRYEVRAENHGAGALPAAREFKPHLVLLDIVMPEHDGGDVWAGLQADQELRATPVLFLTATVTTQEVEARHGSIGGLPFLAKPVAPKQLMRRIEKLMAQEAA